MFTTLKAKLYGIGVLVALLAISAYSGWVYHNGVINERNRNELKQAANVARMAIEAQQALVDAKQSAVTVNLDIRQQEQTTTDTITRLKKEVKKYEQPRRISRPSTVSMESVHLERSGPPSEQVVADRSTAIEQPKEPDCGCDDRVPIGVVRVLNDAVAGTVRDRPSGEGDGEGAAPSTVTRADFTEWALEVVARYTNLANRHNRLVDYVEDLQRKSDAQISTKQ